MSDTVGVIRRSKKLSICTCLTIMLGVLGLPASAWAIEVYFNGVRVTGYTGQTFNGCTVRFDAKGNIHITAPGYSVEPAKPNNTKKNGQVLLVTGGNEADKVQYDVEVWINGAKIATVVSSQPQVMRDVRKHLRRGKNEIKLRAVKRIVGKRLSESDKARLRIVIGPAVQSGRTVTVKAPWVDFAVRADQTHNFEHSQTITVPAAHADR